MECKHYIEAGAEKKGNRPTNSPSSLNTRAHISASRHATQRAFRVSVAAGPTALLRSPSRCGCYAGLEDGGRRAAGEAAGRVERVDAEELVDQAAGDAEHGGAAVLALGVELEGLDLGVVVPHP